MLRRTFLTAALAACTVVPMLAQDRATFVLTNGQRHNGTLVYGRGDNVIVDLNFHLATGSGEQVIPMGDVAVIDFAGGAPPNAEINAVTETPVMVMRNGSTIRGNLHNIIRGDMVQWVNEGGQRQNYPISEVRRLYLDPESARTVFFKTRPTQNVIGTGGNAAASTVRIAGNEQWVDTGFDVRQGDLVQFNASGQIRFAPGAAAVNAGGARGGTSASYPVPMMGAGGLIAKVGDSAAFAVGTGARQLRMPGDGRLYLGINDDDVSDNSGSFTVQVRRR